MPRQRWVLISAATVVGFGPPLALADNWDNSSNDFAWSNATNWADNTEPTSSDTAVFPAVYPGGHGNIVLSAGETASSVTLNNSYSLAGGTLAIGGTGSVTVAASQFGQIHSVLDGTSGLTKAGAGILTIAGVNTFTGNVVVDVGQLQVYNDSNLGNASNNVTIAGGSFVAWNNLTTARTFTMGTGGGEFAVPNTVTLSLTSGLGAGSTALTKSSGGILALEAASTRTGSVAINEGAIRISNATALGTGATAIAMDSSALWIDGVTLNRAISLTGTEPYLIGTGAAAGSIGVMTVGSGVDPHLNAGTSATDVFTIGNAANDFTGGSATSTVLATSGVGTIALGFSNNYSGGWQILGPTIRIGHASSLGSGTSAILLVAGGLEVGGVSLNRAIDFSSAASNPVTLRGTGNASSVGLMTVGAGKNVTLATGTSSADVLTIGNAHNDYTGGSGATTSVTGSGTVALPFSNNYTGAWTLDGGTLRIGHASALGTGSSPVAINGGATLEISGVSLDRPIALANNASIRRAGTGASLGQHTIASGAAVAFSGGVDSSAVLTVGNSVNDLTGGGGGSSINVTGLGTVVLGPASNDYVGDWNLSGNALLRISSDASLGNPANNLNISAGSLIITSSMSTSRSIAVNGGMQVEPGQVFTVNSPLVGSGGLQAGGAGTLILNAPGTRSGNATIFNGTVKVVNASALTSDQILILSGGSMQVLPNGTNAATSRIGNLSMSSSRFDLTDNKLILPTNPVGSWNGSAYTDTTGLIALGRNGGMWNGFYLTTSMSDATAGNDYTGLGIAAASQVTGIGATQTTIWGGLTVEGSDTLVMYTYGGDANLSGSVDIDDYGQIDANASLGGTLTGWFNGDFDYNGVSDIDDYGIIDSVIGIQGPPFPTGAGAGLGMEVVSVPEPSVALGILIAGTSLVVPRRRRQ